MSSQGLSSQHPLYPWMECERYCHLQPLALLWFCWPKVGITLLSLLPAAKVLNQQRAWAMARDLLGFSKEPFYIPLNLLGFFRFLGINPFSDKAVSGDGL